MATIHPTRLGLIPQAQLNERDARRYERPSSSGRGRSRGRSPRRDRSRTRSQESTRSRERERSGDRNRNRNIHRGRDNDSGRRSPQYDDYRKPGGHNADSAGPPWRNGQSQNGQNMYPDRRSRPVGGWSSEGGFLKSRQQQRDSIQLSIWPPSPKAPARDFSPEDRSHKRRKRERSSSLSSSSSTSEERQRRREKKARKKREKEEKKSHRRKHRSRYSSDEQRERDRDKEREREREWESERKKVSKRRSRTQSETRSETRLLETRSPTRSRHASESSDEWVEKEALSGVFFTQPHSTATTMPKSSETTSKHLSAHQATLPSDDLDSDDEFGPQPLTYVSKGRVDERSYGSALLRGEGSAMAAFLAEDTNARIPRRGEIGLTSDQIASFESVGYVMSGSRHRRMNAVRLRKENQVITAEEKRGILKLQKEERSRREELLREEFKDLVDEKLKAVGASSDPAAKKV